MMVHNRMEANIKVMAACLPSSVESAEIHLPSNFHIWANVVKMNLKSLITKQKFSGMEIANRNHQQQATNCNLSL